MRITRRLPVIGVGVALLVAAPADAQEVRSWGKVKVKSPAK
jgi:hypothetical protein